ncbi:MAG: exodeoxyribonuclease VII large subunit [Rickettsiales bacterium]|jgi:exodeoxyribonuclease VII large subunit|nr:exodeoxyribonuclease VII large subunit [Rickettsiales bacterium]
MKGFSEPVKTIAVMLPPEYTVSQISYRLKSVVENEFSYVKIRGEVSGFKLAPSGHAYFSLKDDNATLASVCWKGVFANLAVKPKEGMELICIGKITTYPGQSKYQLVVEKVEHAGIGALMEMLEKRKAQFAKEGLFDADKKKKVPYLPKRIGIITSPTGAVIQDIIHRIKDRFPSHVLLWPVLVQGEKSSNQVSEAIAGFNNMEDKPDVIIVARGGGSVEDLWSFNEENVVRAAYNSKIPLISAIGHETDFTLLDFVADLRAPTPTAAAEMAIPVLSNISINIRSIINRAEYALTKYFEFRKNKLQMLKKSLPNYESILNHFVQRLDDLSLRFVNSRTRYCELRANKLNTLSLRLKHPKDIMKMAEQRLLQASNRLHRAGDICYNNSLQKLKLTGSLLDSYSYKKTLERGFSIIVSKDNNAITSVDQAKSGDKLIAEFHDGKLGVTVD